MIIRKLIICLLIISLLLVVGCSSSNILTGATPFVDDNEGIQNRQQEKINQTISSPSPSPSPLTTYIS